MAGINIMKKNKTLILDDAKCIKDGTLEMPFG